MKIALSDAQAFISTYQVVLATISGKAGKDETVQAQLVRGRMALLKNPALLEDSIAALKNSGRVLDEDVLSAMRQMRVEQWVYLRDTRSHSIFMSMEGDEAYGVLGLTQRLRDITGESGAVIDTALLPFKGRLICDALMANLVWIGSNYRRDFNDDLKRLKAEQRFSTTALLPQLS